MLRKGVPLILTPMPVFLTSCGQHLSVCNGRFSLSCILGYLLTLHE